MQMQYCTPVPYILYFTQTRVSSPYPFHLHIKRFLLLTRIGVRRTLK